MTELMGMVAHEYDDVEAVTEAYFHNGWTDGLPVVAPTPERVELFLAAAGLEPGEILGAVETRDAEVTAVSAAVNAVMAGCLPEYFPVVVAAVRAHLSKWGNAHNSTGTLGGAFQTVVVNGPIRNELGVNCGAGCFGPGFRANATIGRALRLVIRNVTRSVPGELDRASFSSPMRFTFCFGEDEEGSGWDPLHVQRGYLRGDSTATVHSGMYMLPVSQYAPGPEPILDSVVRAFREKGVPGDDWIGDRLEAILVVGPAHRRIFVDAGWSKKDIQGYMWPKLMAPTSGPADVFCNVGRPEGLLVVAAGGLGMSDSYLISPLLASAVTERIELAPTT